MLNRRGRLDLVIAKVRIAEPLRPSRRYSGTDTLAIDAEFGVRHGWYVAPNARTLEVFALADGQWLRVVALKDGDPVTVVPFEAHTFALNVLWAEAGD